MLPYDRAFEAHRRQGAAAWARVGHAGGSGRHDAAVSHNHNILAGELLLQLPHKPLLNLVKGFQQAEWHLRRNAGVDDNEKLSTPNRPTSDHVCIVNLRSWHELPICPKSKLQPVVLLVPLPPLLLLLLVLLRLLPYQRCLAVDDA